MAVWFGNTWLKKRNVELKKKIYGRFNLFAFPISFCTIANFIMVIWKLEVLYFLYVTDFYSSPRGAWVYLL
jgi:hypothetical protein